MGCPVTILWGHWYPMFWTWDDFTHGFKANWLLPFALQLSYTFPHFWQPHGTFLMSNFKKMYWTKVSFVGPLVPSFRHRVNLPMSLKARVDPSSILFPLLCLITFNLASIFVSGLGNQSWFWGSLCASESRVQVMMDPPKLWNPWAESAINTEGLEQIEWQPEFVSKVNS